MWGHLVAVKIIAAVVVSTAMGRDGCESIKSELSLTSQCQVSGGMQDFQIKERFRDNSGSVMFANQLILANPKSWFTTNSSDGQ